ncbi:MAG: hypothetical protein GWM90_22740, partial [Gemmatimonadetes bacterium]|nr:hypothetical protein [Gemmatimonadota bacterium]NIQ57441.1 hypothetical protein [Gemmatimonadota bacterium]NIU77605.1 hypothetical protein [Gammaproteobacteria bacterium]NIX46792.1 hypothetical protein [Gemmatimonadota bacterium]NIY11146.1 hypothetical protein [Gemmatimonadota bacterium]
MERAEVLDSRRYRCHAGMLAVLVVFLLLIFAEVAWPCWGCGLLGFPAFLMGGNPFLVAAVAVAVVLAIVSGSVEVEIDRSGLRSVL